MKKPNVKFTNTLAHPFFVRDVDNSARQPFHADASVTIDIAKNSDERRFRFKNLPEVLVVPPGKRAVIEHFSFRAELQPGQKITEVRLVSTVDGFQLAQYVVPTPQGQLPTESTTLGSPIAEVFTGSQPIREYGDPGTEIRFLLKRNSTTGLAFGSALISGYFVDLP